jgi:hypothetical protein
VRRRASFRSVWHCDDFLRRGRTTFSPFKGTVDEPCPRELIIHTFKSHDVSSKPSATRTASVIWIAFERGGNHHSLFTLVQYCLSFPFSDCPFAFGQRVAHDRATKGIDVVAVRRRMRCKFGLSCRDFLMKTYSSSNLAYLKRCCRLVQPARGETDKK